MEISMNYIAEEIIEDIRQRTNIVDIVSQYLTLKPRGKNFVGVCPFHQEKTPSFNVNPERQIFKCFGCGKGGNVFHFIQAIEHMTFPEAVQKLADKLGIDLNNSQSQEKYTTRDFFELFEWTTQFYEQQLQIYGQYAQEYIQSRGIREDIQKKFRVGYAPYAWELLLQSALQQGFEIEMLEKAGLICKSKKGLNKYFDYFRNRILFPITNIDGKVIAFGGRILEGKEYDTRKQPKYLNSPETNFFNKSRTLYALSLSKETIQEQNKVILMEGYTDVMMMHQFGFTNGVATLGTALTEDHIKIIRRYTDQVYLIYDGDNAGQNAIERAIPLLLKQGLLAKIVVLPEEKDPCEYLLQYGQQAMQNALDKAEEFWDFTIKKSAQKYDTTTVSGQRQSIQELTKITQTIPDKITRELVQQKIANIFNISTQNVKQATLPSPNIVLEPIKRNQTLYQKFLEDDEKFVLWAIMHVPEYAWLIVEKYPCHEYQGTTTKKIATILYPQIQQNIALDISSLCNQIDIKESSELINIYYQEYDIKDERALYERLILIYKGLERRKYQENHAYLRKILLETDDYEKRNQILQDTQLLCQKYFQTTAQLNALQNAEVPFQMMVSENEESD
jgi:DNA primase